MSPSFGIGLHASGAEFRSMDVNGRPIDPTTETPTARAERIWALQDRWQPRQFPSAEPGDVLAEWLAASPDNRMSRFARCVAEHPDWMPEAETEPGPGELPRPGGLVERVSRIVAERISHRTIG